MDSKTIATIQAAGAALHDAQAALAQDGQHCAEQVREALSQDAFSVANDGLFEHWKSISRLSQSLAAMEAQLKDLYLGAVELAATGGTVPRTMAAPRLALRQHLHPTVVGPAKWWTWWWPHRARSSGTVQRLLRRLRPRPPRPRRHACVATPSPHWPSCRRDSTVTASPA